MTCTENKIPHITYANVEDLDKSAFMQHIYTEDAFFNAEAQYIDIFFVLCENTIWVLCQGVLMGRITYAFKRHLNNP